MQKGCGVRFGCLSERAEYVVDLEKSMWRHSGKSVRGRFVGKICGDVVRGKRRVFSTIRVKPQNNKL
jgi:hypothetical protein